LPVTGLVTVLVSRIALARASGQCESSPLGPLPIVILDSFSDGTRIEEAEDFVVEGGAMQGITAMRAGVFAMVAAILFCCAGRSPSPPATVRAIGPMAARGADGGTFGSLEKLGDFPLYELRYEAAYDLERMVAASTAASAAGSRVPACTCFAAKEETGHRIMGRNFDWDRHPVLVLLTRPKEGYASLSLVDLHYLGYSPERPPETAPSKLIDAPALPFDGMNERGLAVGMMAVGHAEGGGSGATKPKLSSLGLIRLLLDRTATVTEALGLLDRYAVVFEEVPLHYFIADASGASVIVEFVAGERRVFPGETGWQVSTNFLFSETEIAARKGICQRYALATARLEETGGVVVPLDLLAKVSQPSTLWSSVYDQTELTLSLALGRNWDELYRWSLRDGRVAALAPASTPREEIDTARGVEANHP
jgi:hypothetical protein